MVIWTVISTAIAKTSAAHCLLWNRRRATFSVATPTPNGIAAIIAKPILTHLYLAWWMPIISHLRCLFCRAKRNTPYIVVRIWDLRLDITMASFWRTTRRVACVWEDRVWKVASHIHLTWTDRLRLVRFWQAHTHHLKFSITRSFRKKTRRFYCFIIWCYFFNLFIFNYFKII